MTATIPVAIPYLVLSVRWQYHSCHIQLPDSDERVAAIAIHNQYYSLFQVIESPMQTVDIVVRLGQRGNEVAVRQLPVGGYALWVKEDDAIPSRSAALIDRRSTRQPKPAFCYILTSSGEAQSLEIKVPDLDKSLWAIYVNEKYYSLFKAQASIEQTLELVAKLAQRGDETIMVASPDQMPHYSVYVLEPDATPV